jgi:TetR/AcrR family transcriptional regulator, lmrAB and yxaGH operons repressor
LATRLRKTLSEQSSRCPSRQKVDARASSVRRWYPSSEYDRDSRCRRYARDDLEHTGTPRGSVYYHFPGGKEQLILAALDLTGQRHDRFVERFRGTSAEEITAGYLDLWRRILVRSRLESGCPILAVTVSVPAGPLLDRAGAIFRTSQRLLVDLYEEVGVLRSAAERFVTFLVASAEGAVVLSRAQQDIEPFEVVADQLIQQAVAMPKVVSTTADHQAPATSTRVKRAASSRG